MEPGSNWYRKTLSFLNHVNSLRLVFHHRQDNLLTLVFRRKMPRRQELTPLIDPPNPEVKEALLHLLPRNLRNPMIVRRRSKSRGSNESDVPWSPTQPWMMTLSLLLPYFFFSCAIFPFLCFPRQYCYPIPIFSSLISFIFLLPQKLPFANSPKIKPIYYSNSDATNFKTMQD